MSGVRRQGSRLSRQAGTTVSEALVTLSVVGMVTSMSALTSSRLQPLYVMRGAASQVSAELQKTRLSAITENNRYVVRFTSDHTATILDDNNNDGLADPGESVTTADLQLDWPGVTIATTGALTFLPDGTVSAPVTITLQKPDTATKTITVSREGSVRIR